jgi:hypothetical protein
MHPELTLLIAHDRRRHQLGRAAERARMRSLASSTAVHPAGVRHAPAWSRQPPRLRLVPPPVPTVPGPTGTSRLGALGPQTPAA